VTDETKNLPPEQWQESPGDAPPICRCSSGDKNWGEDPVRPMPRHNGRVDCLMLDGAVKDYTVHEITLPKESSPLCLWDAN
jgi:prepilin-type processing-associated H-X9-DG protein